VLRKLLMLGQIITSHALHIFFFSLSDFFGVDNDLELIAKYPEKAKDAMAIREFGNKIIEIIGGRSIHPLTPEVGGFTKLPKSEAIEKIGDRAKEILPKAIGLAELFAKLKYPKFERKTEFVSLFSKNEYAIYDGEISVSGKKSKIDVYDFLKKVKEFQVAEDAVKRTELDEKPYMVGAIARINNNGKQLNPRSQKILKASKIKLPSLNPFHNILAQAIETVHCIEEVIRLIDSVRGLSSDKSKICAGVGLPAEASAKAGAAAIEAPRGTLFYFYEVGDNGLIKNCNIITPTAQNLARLEEDLKIWLPQLKILKLSEREIKDKIKMLIRAYDPCLTCATH
jgi:coenzyme F420-reducing hydrogenase alpha subunit